MIILIIHFDKLPEYSPIALFHATTKGGVIVVNPVGDIQSGLPGDVSLVAGSAAH